MLTQRQNIRSLAIRLALAILLIASAATMVLPGDREAVYLPTSRVALGQGIRADELLHQLKPQSHVNDWANLLNESERLAMEDRLVQLRRKTGAEVAVVTLPSLQGGQIDDFANKLFQAWGIGQKGKDDGVLLLVAMQDRKARIEVGYGLEPILPDALAGRILDERLFPAFKKQQYAAGLDQAVLRVTEIIERGEPAPADTAKRAAGPASVGGQIAIVLFLGLFIALGFAVLGFSVGGLAAAVAVWTGVRRGAANLPGRFVGSLFLMVWGAGFGVIPLVIAVQQVAWSGYIHGPLAVVMFLLGAALSFRGGGLSSRRGDSSPWPWTGGSTWSGFGGDWSSGSGSSGGGFSADFGGFGGGSSGGGGASGGW